MIDLFDAVRKAIRDAGCQLRPEYIFMGRYRLHTGYQATQQFLRLAEPPTAIVAANDTLGIGSMKYLLQNRIRIPDDVAVIGLDNVPLSAMYEPALSTTTLPIERRGLKAVKMLMIRIQRPQCQSRNILLGTELVIRSSTDKKSPVVAELQGGRWASVRRHCGPRIPSYSGAGLFSLAQRGP